MKITQTIFLHSPEKLGRLNCFFALGPAFLLVFFAATLISEVVGQQLQEKKIFTVGLPDTLVNPADVLELRKTLNTLKKRLPQYHFEVTAFVAADSSEVLRNKVPNFLILPSGFLSSLGEEWEKSAHKIATRTNSRSTDPEQTVGAALVTLTERKDLNELLDLKGKTAIGGLPNAVDGWLGVRDELKRKAFNDESFFSKLFFTNNAYPDVLSAVINKTVDVGILPACLLEELEEQGLVEKNILKVIGEKGLVPLKCRRSTNLFPDISLWAMQGTPREVVRDVTLALFSSETRLTDNWLPNVSERRMLDLFRTLEEGPYSYLKDFSPAGLYRRYTEWVWLGLFFLLYLVFNEIRLNVLVKNRTAMLADALWEKDKFELRATKVRRALNAYEKRSVVQQMSGMIAHELSSPLGTIRTYVALLKMKDSSRSALTGELREKALNSIELEVVKISEIIDRVRNYAKNNRMDQQPCDLEKILHQAIRALSAERGPDSAEMISFCEINNKAKVFGNPLELEILFLNLLRNSVDAVSQQTGVSLKNTRPVKVSIKKSESGSQWTCMVKNYAKGLTEEELEQINQQSYSVSTKAAGLGLGLSICRGICDRHGASLHFELKGEWLEAEFCIDLLSEGEKKKVGRRG
ncbi:ATP-binding protein [Turicimonas muris]|uniref:ATP-binding protein n=1 Tax=Turicimonas muris TaxID=1796652 RepID=UPI00249406AD|nr:ATP-binding protein [Turicimonas muris]